MGPKTKNSLSVNFQNSARKIWWWEGVGGGVMVDLKKAKKVRVKKIRQPLKEARDTKNGFHGQFLFSRGKKYRYSI